MARFLQIPYRRAVGRVWYIIIRFVGTLLGTKTIAVIDDDPDIAAILAEILTDEAYEPVIWRRGAGAYEFIKRQHPLAIILDVRMETPDAGLKVAESLAADPETRTIPIIVCSGEDEFVRRNRQRLHGLSFSVVAKPFSIPRLLAILNNATVRQRYSLPTG
jgi:CheY-like chemotaxis protein